MNLAELARQLRSGADLLDHILGSHDHTAERREMTETETSETAHLIRQSLRRKQRRMAPPRRKTTGQNNGKNGHKTIDLAYAVLSAVKPERMSAHEMVPEMRKLGWQTTSDAPDAIVAVTLRELGRVVGIRRQKKGNQVKYFLKG